MRLKPVSLAIALSLLAGCAASTSFSTTFPVGGPRVGETLERARAAASDAGPALIVGVADTPRSVFAYDLRAGRMLFRANAPVVGLPAFAGELVAVPEATKITLRRLRDGVTVHEIPLDGMHLIGAGGDATTSAIVLSTGGTINARSRLLILRGEHVTSDQKLDRGLGVPAVLGGITFVPHSRVHLSAIDAHGNELLRVRAQDDVASEAFVREGNVYFGQRGFYRLDPETERGAKSGAHFWKLALKHKLPGAPPLLGDSTEPKPALESALYRVRLSFAPESSATSIGLLDDTLYLVFYRQLFGLTPDGGAARWVHETESDVVGIQAIPGGLLAVESSGAISAIDASGLTRFSANLGLAPIAVSIRAERFEQGSSSGAPEPLAERLERAARNPDTRLVPSRTFAATLLGSVDEDEAARSLIALCSDDAAPTRVRTEACETLSRRQQPSDAVIAALALHADFIAGTTAPPSAALALAALHAGDRRAVPGLLGQLDDPATALEDVPAILRALGGLGDASTAPRVGAFVRLYHADTNDESFEDVLAVAMDALVKLDRERARLILEPIANDAFARVGVRTAAQRRVTELGPAPRDEGDEAPAPASADAVEATAPVAEGPPANLTSQHLDDALAPVRAQLSRCVHDAPQHPASARLVIVIDGEGTVLDVHALPQTVQPCAAPLVQSVTFPATKYGRRSIMNYSIGQ